MLFQLINQNVPFYQYFINAFLVIIGRMLDILSTRYVTKELKLETNKLAQRAGWKGMIIMQIPIIILASLDFYFAFFVFIWSLLLFANNVEGSWHVKEVGEDKYFEEIKTTVKRAKTWQIVLGEISYIITFTLSGILILIFIFVYRDLLIVLFIALALICQGVLATLRSLSYLLDIKREDSEEESEVVSEESDDLN